MKTNCLFVLYLVLSLNVINVTFAMKMKNNHDNKVAINTNAQAGAEVHEENKEDDEFMVISKLIKEDFDSLHQEQEESNPNSLKHGKLVLEHSINSQVKLLQRLKQADVSNLEEKVMKKLKAFVSNTENNIKSLEENLKKLREFEQNELKQAVAAEAEIKKNEETIAKVDATLSAEYKLNYTPNNAFLQLSNTALTSAQIAGSCLQGALSNIPPSFCYKKGADAGKIPDNCPSGYFRSLALCYEQCKDNYTHVAGVCWEKCGSGYKDLGASCFKWNWFKSKTYFKKTYIPGSITNFSDRVTCDSGYYKSGALCYKDCNNIGLVNCGIGACAASAAACGSGIGLMAVEFALGLAEGIAFVASFGTSSAGSTGFAAAKEKLITGFKNISKSALGAGLDTVKRFASKAALKNLLKSSTKTAAKKALKEQLTTTLATTLVETVCDQIVEDFLTRSANSSSVDSLDLTALDPTGIAAATQDCANAGKSTNDNSACAKAILNVVSIADPTGLTSMAAALIQDTCDVPTTVPT